MQREVDCLQRCHHPEIELLHSYDGPLAAYPDVLDLRPDVLLLAIPPGGTGEVELAIRVRRLLPETYVVILAGFDDLADFHALQHHGIRLFLRPDEPAATLSTVIRHAALVRNAEPDDLDTALLARARFEVGPRELEVLHLLATGLDNQQIAERLSIEKKTVEFHLRKLYQKLDVRNRTEALLVGLHHGLVSLASSYRLAHRA